MNVMRVQYLLIGVVVFAFACPLLMGCAGRQERELRRAVEQSTHRPNSSAPRGDEAEPRLGPRLVDYLVYATDHSPELRAEYERLMARVHSIPAKRTLPDPMLEFGVFVWNSGQNAGLTGARVGVKQEFPWPTRLSAGADAASAEGRVQLRRLEAKLLDLKWRVAQAYYRVWLIQRMREIEREQLVVVRGLSESAVGQVATGSATLADVQQIELNASRLEDALLALSEEEKAALAVLSATVGAPPSAVLKAEGAVEGIALPAEPQAALKRAVLGHPAISLLSNMSEANEAMLRMRRAERLPGLVLGIEWMRMPGEMGMSAISPNLGLRLPLWQGSYAHGVKAARAELAATEADREALMLSAQAELESILSQVRDSHRRVELNEGTLLSQAEAAYASVLGAYATGRSSITASLWAQRDILEIRIELERARAQHLVAWARLEQVVGRAVEREKPVGGKK